jgi:cell division protein FtsZ
MTIGEFDEVGNTVRDFADEDATVVVGTVIDLDMQDDLRVTVVATGLGSSRLKSAMSDRSESVEPAIRLVANNRGDDVGLDYRELIKRPAVWRTHQGAKGGADVSTDGDMEYLDIPAFLRRQAD